MSKFEIWMQMVEIVYNKTDFIWFEFEVLRYFDLFVILLCSMEFQFVILKVVVRVLLNGARERVEETAWTAFDYAEMVIFKYDPNIGHFAVRK